MMEVETLVEAYLQRFPGEANGLERLRGQLRDREPIFDRRNFRGHATASGLVLDDGKLLLIMHRGLGKYLQPGGHHEAGESPESCARREVTEETGVEVTVHPWHAAHGGIPLHIDTHPIPRSERKGEDAHFHHDFIYLFSPVAGSQLRPQLSEVSECRWVPLTTKLDDSCLGTVAEKLAALGLIGSRGGE